MKRNKTKIHTNTMTEKCRIATTTINGNNNEVYIIVYYFVCTTYR